MGKLVVLDGGYGTIPNKILRNKDLSAKAKGLWVYFQSKPNGWEFSADRIIEEMADGRDSIQSGIRELEKAGFLTRKRYKNDKGHWEWEHSLRENPYKEATPELGFPATDNPASKQEILSNKENTLPIPTEIGIESPFSSKEWIDKLQESEQPHIALIGYYFGKYAGYKFPTLAVAKKEMAKNLKPATFLVKNYPYPDITKALKFCRDKYGDVPWNLSTVEKQMAYVTSKKY